jgi:hypothetical protein
MNLEGGKWQPNPGAERDYKGLCPYLNKVIARVKILGLALRAE